MSGERGAVRFELCGWLRHGGAIYHQPSAMRAGNRKGSAKQELPDAVVGFDDAKQAIYREWRDSQFLRTERSLIASIGLDEATTDDSEVDLFFAGSVGSEDQIHFAYAVVFAVDAPGLGAWILG